MVIIKLLCDSVNESINLMIEHPLEGLVCMLIGNTALNRNHDSYPYY